MRRSRMPLGWATVWLFFCFGPLTSRSVIMDTSSLMQNITDVSPLHNGQFCSTWGNHHFKTFDGDFFQFPFACNYVLTSHCRSAYEDFNIQLSRQQVDGVASIKRVMMRLDGVLVELANTSLTVNDKQITIPFSQYGLSIQRKGSYVRIEAKLGLVVMWNENDTLWVEMDEKYMNQTCGLCGDYNGVQLYNEFISHGVVKDTLNYGTSWKVDAPTETCMESHQEPTACANQTNRCMELLSEPAFLSCQDLLNMDAFVEACEKDLCHCGNGSTCLCPTMAEFSRQCAHAGGTPLPWKTAELCANECPFNLEYMECGNTCRATCTQPESSQPCEEHCESGCFCPAGMVFDDVTQSGCVALQQCYCQHNGKAYRPGESFSGPCRTCTCTLGKWSCQEHECPATCSFLGGSHITTYDDKSYTFHGECTFVLSKDINGSYIVLGDIAKLSQTDTESLMAVTLLYGAKRKIKIESTGKVFYNDLAHKLPLNIDNITVFRPSTFFVVVHAVDGLQLEIQIVPTMQLYIKVDVSYKGQLRGLCGDFNDVEADDFKTTNGMIAGTAATYANTWRAQPSCPDVTNRISNPCSLSVDKERYSNYWCALLSDANGIFAPCHSEIDPSVYEVACLHDTCLCERSEDCMCAALSSYVHACRAVGVSLKGWRNNTCTKYSSSCPEGLVYSYRLTGCQPSCLGLSQPHASCQVAFSPMDGCGCAPGTYLNEEGRCVPASQCCCYEGDVVIRPGQTHWKQGTACTCKDGVQHCVGKATSCTAPMVFFNCSGLQQGARGSECQKSCRSEDSECISDRCVSGCMCPEGSLTDGAGGCVKEDLCPCLYNSVSYTPGQTVKVDCNTCECRARKWECTTHECDGICTIYGDGHYISFDEKKFSFNGDCGYTFAQDYCHGEMSNGTFRVVTENIPCASIDSTCSMAIKLYLGNTEILLSDEKIKVIKQSHEAEIPYQVHSIGIYLVIEAKNGLILIWNKKTTLMIKLNPSYKGQLCGLCGNYDGSVKNDFTTRNHEVVAEAVQFGNSWKVSPTCPDVDAIKRPCQLYSHRQAWALKHCSIIDSEVFAACHSQVDPTNYYDACVKDTCACNSGGDCECFCSAVEAYAAACNRAGACVRWRTPSICPLFCDFYNPIGECEWHYEPCGDTCLKTCKNPTATCSSQIPAMEGCYPRCPPDQPYLEERTMKCVSNQQCGCYDNNDKHYEEGDTMPSEGNCKTCRCSSTQRTCKYDVQACICIYNGNKYHYGATIYSTHDGDGACFTAVCEEGGHINRTLTICPFTTPTPTTTTQEPTTTIFTFSTSGVITFTTTVPPTYSTLTTIEQSSTTTTTAQSTTITTTEQPTTTREHPSTTTTTEQPTTATTTTEQPTTPTTTEQSTTASTTAQPHVSTRTSQGPTTIPTTTEQSTTPTTTEQSTTLTTTEQSTTQVKTTTTSLTTTPHGCLVCKWTAWNNNHYPDYNGENETIESIPQIDLSRCNSSLEIQCRASEYKDVSLEALGQRVTCDTTVGLVCQSKDQIPPRCHDYEIRVKCCDQCEQSTTTATTEQPTTPTTTEQSTTPTTTIRRVYKTKQRPHH
ncbi:mucin-5B-like [Gadus morhua]|uniref:mucin-5B-like n=1 Tax=Gadus morhua TaxID=8049 RepID=UPI0011B7010C|nr:mucin-5B-like [Gadus morhua]